MREYYGSNLYYLYFIHHFSKIDASVYNYNAMAAGLSHESTTFTFEINMNHFRI